MASLSVSNARRVKAGGGVLAVKSRLQSADSSAGVRGAAAQPVGGVAFGPPHFKKNPIYVADNRVMLLTSLQCPESHIIGASHVQKNFEGHLSCRNTDSTVISACI